MGWQPGGEPPPPPPVPPESPRPAPWDAPPPPEPSGRGPGDQGRPALAAGLAIALAVSLAINVILALRVKDETDQQAALRARVEELRDEVDTLRRKDPGSGRSILQQIASAVEKIRELKFKTTVKSQVVTDEKLADEVEKRFVQDSPRKEIDESDAVLTTLGLLGKNDDLYSISLGVVREQVAGFYDFKKKLLVAGGDAVNPTPLDEVLLAHEYVHALTDQYYDLNRLDALHDARKDDEATALACLVEGDATVMMFNYASQYLTPSERVQVQQEAAAAPSQRLESAPKALREALLFPYEEGASWVRSLIANGGVAALNKAYQDPPTSTEQILHIAKYLNRDEPTPVEMPNLARSMGSGWTPITGGGVGELDVRLIVDQFLPRSEAERAAAGWDGGRYAAADSNKGTIVAALTVWDSETEAREATSTFGRWLPARFGNKGNDARFANAVGRGWESADGAGAVFRDGARVLLVIGPDRASVERARGAFAGF